MPFISDDCIHRQWCILQIKVTLRVYKRCSKHFNGIENYDNININWQIKNKDSDFALIVIGNINILSVET